MPELQQLPDNPGPLFGGQCPAPKPKRDTFLDAEGRTREIPDDAQRRVEEPAEGTMAARILTVLRAYGPKRDGLAIFEIATILYGEGKDHLVSQRFSEMLRKGWIKKTGERRTRPISNKPCDVYEAVTR
jgi:hypothetical protein